VSQTILISTGQRAAARAGAERRTDLDLARLRRTLEEMQALDANDTEHRPKLAHAFHFALWQASHNATLISTLEGVHLRVMVLSSTTLHYPQRWELFSDECAELFDAIRERAVDRAGEIAAQQMIIARDFRIKIYSSDPNHLP